jgi:AcrR family transcriptional regulator
MRQGEIEAAQDRSRRTRDRLVIAFGALLREKPFDAITMAELAERAGIAVGTVYRRFANKDALIPVIFEVYLKMLEHYAADPANALQLDEADTLRSALGKMCVQAWQMLRREPQLIRTAHLYARMRPDLVGEDWDAIIETSVAQFRQLIDHFGAEVKRPDPDAASRMLFYLLNTVMVEQGLYGEAGPGAALKAGNVQFVQGCATTIYGYLTADES